MERLGAGGDRAAGGRGGLDHWLPGVLLVVVVEVVLLVVVLVVVVTNCSNCSNPLPARRSGPGQAAAWCSTGPRRTGARGLAHLAKATHTFTPKK